ncbi:carbohydrate ABC transporter permease [Frondihabitans australicus]|uniref:Multiple sugar transport system permease protein n=1 Tax=Frondihabitans australicus TaxID=386892 RepID=A0A495IGK8_9MICO|nr:sugar ABC transporter permease [Frondihabitans australicus]RKR74451.1 multiple sugar transport system permease protein [Frondihabitans australicus]
MTTSANTLASARPAAAERRRPRTSSDKRRQHIAAYVLIAPFFLVFLAMLVVPLFYSGYLSLFQTKLVGGTTFVGIANYIRAFTDSQFLSGLGRMGLFLIIQVPVMVCLALFVALAIDSGRAKASTGARLLIFIPYAVPGVVATLLWGYIYGTDFGPITQIFQALGLHAPNLLSNANVLGSLMNIVTWEFVGYNMVIMYSALRSIPTDLYEAAEIDGAGQFRIAWSIKIPAIRPAILLTVIFSIIGTFQLFNEPELLQSIAPNAISSSYTPNLYAYTLAFVNHDVNYAATIAFALGFVIMIISFVVQIAQQRSQRQGASA